MMDNFKFPTSPTRQPQPTSPLRQQESPTPINRAHSPAQALFPLSPERVNAHRSQPASLASSPARSKYEFGKSTPLRGYTTSGTGRPMTAALAASMAAAPTIAPFQVDATETPSRSPFRNAAHSRVNSDAMVQGMIARFDGLSVRDWKAQGEVALKRAEMAREMAEMEGEKFKALFKAEEEDKRNIKEEGRKLKKDIEEGKERERKTARRLEVLMDELSRAKDTHSHTVTIYEKEIRKARKEAFKASSSLVKVQEDLKATRAQYKTSQSNLEAERLKAAKREQEAFTAQYQIVGVQEELQRALERCKVVEEERDHLKTSLKEEEVLRIAAEGRIALPVSQEDDDDLLLMSPTKSPMKSPRKMQRQVVNESESEKENMQPMRKNLVQLKALQEELILERRLRRKADDQIDFMKMECQFESCSCRIAEQKGKKYVHDDSFAREMKQIKDVVSNLVGDYDQDTMEVDEPGMESQAAVGNSLFDLESAQIHERIAAQEQTQTVEEQPARRPSRYSRRASRRESLRASPANTASTAEIEQSRTLKRDHESIINFSEEPLLEEPEPQYRLEAPQYENEDIEVTPIPQSLMDTSFPETPAGIAFRTKTTTTTIPIQFSPVKQPLPTVPSLPATPRTVSHPLFHSAQLVNDENRPPPTPNGLKADGTIDRAAALEMINQRRVRARSMGLGQATPKKQMVEGNVRRDVSAPNVGAAATGGGWKQ